MKNLVIGLIFGSFVSCIAQAALTRHYATPTQEEVQKCLSEVVVNGEINTKSEVSFHFNEDGLDFDNGTCWPDGIDIAK